MQSLDGLDKLCGRKFFASMVQTGAIIAGNAVQVALIGDFKVGTDHSHDTMIPCCIS